MIKRLMQACHVLDLLGSPWFPRSFWSSCLARLSAVAIRVGKRPAACGDHGVDAVPGFGGGASRAWSGAPIARCTPPSSCVFPEFDADPDRGCTATGFSVVVRLPARPPPSTNGVRHQQLLCRFRSTATSGYLRPAELCAPGREFHLHGCDRMTLAPAILRFRHLFLFTLLLAVGLVAGARAASWWDCNWSARTPIAVAKPGSTLSNYTLEVMLNAKDLPGYNWSQLDTDLRVVDEDDKTPLTFFVQPRSASTQVVRLWVSMPTLSTAKTIYVYYGNKSAASTSNGVNTFAAAGAGVRIWTRKWGGSAFANEAQSYGAWNAGNDAATGYSCAVSKSFSSVTNASLFGSGSNISWNVTSVLYVAPAQAGTWGVRWGPDLGVGGGLYVDDVPVQEAWGSDLWWGSDWSNTKQILQGTVYLSAGYHVIRGIGSEGCCDGGQQIDLSMPNGKWINLSAANHAISAPSCQLALAAPQPAQMQSSTASCGAVHFQITNAATGLYCLNQAIAVNVLDASNNPVSSYSGTMALSTTTAKGSWTLTSGAGTFVDSVPDDGAATYQWPGNAATATFALSYRAGTNPVIVHAVDQSNGTLMDDGTQSAMVFSPSGFTVTSSPFTNPASGVPTFASPQTAGNTISVYLTAYGQNPADASCGIITNYSGAKALKFWSTYVNPSTGTRNAAINATTIATSEASAAAQSVVFNAGQATVTAVYKDVGSQILSMKDDTTGNANLPNGIRGSTGTFVWKPANFIVSGIKRTSDSFANPAASTPGGTVFLGAGQPFTATVTAVESGGSGGTKLRSRNTFRDDQVRRVAGAAVKRQCTQRERRTRWLRERCGDGNEFFVGGSRHRQARSPNR